LIGILQRVFGCLQGIFGGIDGGLIARGLGILVGLLGFDEVFLGLQQGIEYAIG